MQMNNNSRKYIVLTIAVLFIGLAIAGGTYAWLILGYNATNGHYVISTDTYTIDYVRGTDVTDLPSLVTGTPDKAAHLLVRAKKATNNFSADLDIYLNTLPETDSAFLQNGMVYYAVCVGECDSFTNIHILNNTNKIRILENSTLTTDYTDYHVYFWLDGTSNMNNLVSKQYYGYISAEATLR